LGKQVINNWPTCRDWGRTVTPQRGHFCKSSKTDEKKIGGMGEWRHQPNLNFSLNLLQVVFKDQIQRQYILYNC